MGLRLGETLNLKVSDIDSERMKVHIHCAKGRKDRFVILPQLTLMTLRRYWKSHRHPKFLFPQGRTAQERSMATKVMDRGGLQKSFKTIVQDVGIQKAITLHSLRHCYGTHCVEAGINLRTIQHEMGHECPTGVFLADLVDFTLDGLERFLGLYLFLGQRVHGNIDHDRQPDYAQAEVAEQSAR